MAHFHGTMHGNGAEIGRLGSKTSGFNATVHSMEGGVHVHLYESNGEDRISIRGGPHGSEMTHLIYDGPLKDISEGKVKL